MEGLRSPIRPILAPDLEVQAQQIAAQEQVAKEASTLGITLTEHQGLKIQNLLNALAILQTRATADLLESDPARFEAVEVETEQLIRQMNILLIAFQTQIEVEYPFTPSLRRSWAGFLGLFFVSWRRYADAMARREICRTALLKSKSEYENMARSHQDHIRHVRDSRFFQRQQEILRANPRYQRVLQEQRDAQTDSYWLESLAQSELEPSRELIVRLCGKWNNGFGWHGGEYQHETRIPKDMTMWLTHVHLKRVVQDRITSRLKEREYLEQHALRLAREENAETTVKS